ncbi:GATA type zinc finger transcription factor family protein [Hibiscus syriacus]|uniref:F-box protein n=1 Tax=Hibiscus syriacus TaxID=106335 RepID=A0A6A2Z3T8_HIBSY|nr:F-box protein At3g12350-like [Hibiscus syriacus]KAE8685742.1 GATA type zinc finger transcription factor family protein [Hibiscus syriacus]
MANPKGSSFPFSDIPEDIQLCILSLLSPPDFANFASTSKRFVSLCRNDAKLWFTMYHRRWGSKTHITQWGGGNISYMLLYKTLTRWENLIGLWRHSGRADLLAQWPRVITFEWGPSFVSGSCLNGTYHVTKSPFLWMGISSDGLIVNFLDLEGQTETPTGGLDCWLDSICSDHNLVPVTLNFMGDNHFMVEENSNFWNCCKRNSSSKNMIEANEETIVVGAYSGKPRGLPDYLVLEM